MDTITSPHLDRIYCRGRSGEFVHVRTQITKTSDGLARFEVYSRKSGRHAPIQIEAPVEQLIEYFETVIKMLRNL
jgi:hypothetical protein